MQQWEIEPRAGGGSLCGRSWGSRSTVQLPRCRWGCAHVEVSAGGGGLSLQLFELPRTDREAIGTFLGLARAERAARKRSRARGRGETADREAIGFFRARARAIFF